MNRSNITMAILMAAFLPAVALAKTPHTVDFNRGSNDSNAGRAPTYMGVCANNGNGCDPKNGPIDERCCPQAAETAEPYAGE